MRPIRESIMESIIVFGGVILALVILPMWIIHIYHDAFPSGAKTLILPEDICQVERGDHLQLYQSHDTIYLEYTFPDTVMRPKDKPIIRGTQVTVGGDENFGEFKDSTKGINIDTLVKVWNLAKQVDSNLEKVKK